MPFAIDVFVKAVLSKVGTLVTLGKISVAKLTQPLKAPLFMLVMFPWSVSSVSPSHLSKTQELITVIPTGNSLIVMFGHSEKAPYFILVKLFDNSINAKFVQP